MVKERIKLLEVLLDSGYESEQAITKIGIAEIVQLQKFSYNQILLLDQLQKAIKAGKLLPYLAGKWPENWPPKAKAEPVTTDVQPDLSAGEE